MKRSLVTLWLIGIFILCFPLSYVTNVITNTHMTPEDFKIIVIICTFIAFIVFGLITWIVYYFLKRSKNENKTKISLIVFTVLVIGVTGVNSVEFGEKMKKRNEYVYLHDFRKGFIESCTEKGKAMKNSPELAGIDSLDAKISDYCSCTYWKMEDNTSIRAKMLDQNYPMGKLLSDPDVLKIVAECALESFED